MWEAAVLRTENNIRFTPTNAAKELQSETDD